MVRHYKRKTTRGDQYSREDVKRAVEEVKAGRMTTYRASQVFKIPFPTLLDHVKGRRGVKSQSQGRPTALSLDIEREIANGLLAMEKHGFGLSRDEIMNLVEEYVVSNSLKTPFRDSKPNSDWLQLFMKRHNLSVKKPQSVEIARRNCIDPFVIYSYFDQVEKTKRRLGLENKPNLVFNLDETSFSRDPSKTKVVGGKGLPSIRTTSSPGRENISVLLAVSADGHKLPPLIIFKGKNLWDDWQPKPGEAYPGTTYAVTGNGWMETEVFENYFQKSFLPSIGDERPVLLVCDGHKTHVSLKLVECARKAGVEIVILPPHSSHILQPLDLSVMKPVKVKWDEKLVAWQKHHIGQKLPKKVFVKLISEVWTNLDPAVIVSGFAKAGIHPFSSNVVHESDFDPAKLQLWKDTRNNNESTLFEDDHQHFNSEIECLAVNTPTSFTALNNSSSSPSQLSGPKIGTASDVLPQLLSGNEDCLLIAHTFDKTPPNPGSSVVDHNPDLSHITATPGSTTQGETPTDNNPPDPDSSTLDPNPDSSNANVTLGSSIQSEMPNPQPGKTIQQLILETIKSHKSELKTKKTKVAGGSEVITSEEAYQRLLLKQQEKKRQEELKENKKKEREAKKRKKQNKIKPKKRKNCVPKPVSDDSSEESELDQSHLFQDSDEDLDLDTYIQQQLDDDNSSTEEQSIIEDNNDDAQEEGFTFKPVCEVAVGDWVLVKFAGKKFIKHFVGKVRSFESGDPMVEYVRKHSSSEGVTTFKAPPMEDVSSVEMADIVNVLPPPDMGRRGEVLFNNDFATYNLN